MVTKKTPAKAPVKKPAAKKPAPAKTKAPPKAPPVRRRKAAPVPHVHSPQPTPRPSSSVRFCLYDLAGAPKEYYRAEPGDPRGQTTAAPPTVAHHVVVVDRSGSMYGAIEPLKDTLVKLLTVDEFTKEDLLVSLLSYSSKGDLTTHFTRSPVKEVMAAGSRQRTSIAAIRSTAMTCISQALEAAVNLVRADETTAVTLHTDGYANDPSPRQEQEKLHALAQSFRGKAAFLNTVAYSDYTDFRLLAALANEGGGACLKAGNVAAVYQALYAAHKSLGGVVAPPVKVALPPGAAYQTAVSRAAGRVLGAAGDLQLAGIRADADLVCYRYHPMTAKEYAASPLPRVQTGEPLYALSRAWLAEGRLNDAKFALGSTFDATMLKAHSRALTNAQVAALAGALDEVVVHNPQALVQHEIAPEVPVNTKPSVLRVVDLLADNLEHFTVSAAALQAAYTRRGLKKLRGQRDKETGVVAKPWLDTRTADPTDWVQVSSFDTNRDTANLNMTLSRRVELVPAAGGPAVTEVAGVKLDHLRTYNAYTLVGDGEVNVPSLDIKVGKHGDDLVSALKLLGVLTPLTADAPKGEKTYRVTLGDLPVVPATATAPDLAGVFIRLAGLKVLASACAAQLKDASTTLTQEQVAELKRHYVSPNLFVNFPTCVPYRKLEDAVAAGEVDARVTYRIKVGSHQILNLDAFRSANQYLGRFYELVGADGLALDGATFADAVAPGVTFREKARSPRQKPDTPADALAKTYLDDLLGVAKTGKAADLLKAVGAARLAAVVKDRHAKKFTHTAEQLTAALADARTRLDRATEELFREKLNPLVFYVGATGLLPAGVAGTAMTAEQARAKFPGLEMDKDEEDGTYFDVGQGTILGVVAETVYFSTEKGVAAAAAA